MKSKLLISGLCALLLGGIFATPAHGQFLGYTSQQTVTSTPFKNVSCPVVGQSVIVPNIGQTAHFLTAQVGGVGQLNFMTANVGGSYDGVNFTNISDLLTNPVSTVLGSGYYPVFRVTLTCQGTGAVTVTINYSGQSITSGPSYGDSQVGLVDKVLAVLLPSNNSAASLQAFTPPFGTSGGTIVFDYVGGAGPAGSTISAQCTAAAERFAGDNTPYTIATFPLATTANVKQTFSVPAVACSFFNLDYVPGGVSSQPFSLDMIFTPQVSQITSTDPCASPGTVKSSAVITAPATSTTQIVPLAAGELVYACSFQASQSAAGAFQWEYGTGASCGTGTTTLTGVETTLSGQPVWMGYGGTLFKAPAGNALCVVTTTAGAVNGVLTYVQQ